MATLLYRSCVLLGCLISVTTAAPEPKVVRMQTSRVQPRSTILKRAPLSVTIGNEPLIGLYYVNASVGSPPQTVQLQIDTGSSDVWMFGPQSCNTSTSQCLGGTFDPFQSSTLVEFNNKGTFSIQYDTPGSGVVGDYVQDSFGIGGMTIKNLTMAVATAADYVPTGIMGIGFDTDESVARASDEGLLYPNLVDELVKQNLITTHAYSLWLDDLDSDSGTVLFGGYDTDKYSGDLGVLQIQPDAQSGNTTSMTVAWTSLSLTDPTSGTTTLTDDSFAEPAVLDSGTSLCGVPTDLYNQLANFSGVINDPTYGAIVACNLSSYTGTLNFGFGGSGGPSISVPFYELAVPTVDENNDPLTLEDGSAACTFGLFPVDTGDDILFGDTFLRSAYVVYDLDNLQIGIAPTNFNSTTSNIQVIGASDTIVGGASSIASGVTVTQTNTAKVTPGIAKTGTVTSLATKAPAATFGAISGIKTDAGATGTATAAKAPATATGSAATPSVTKSAASTTIPIFDATTIFMMGGSFLLMLLGGVFVVLG